MIEFIILKTLFLKLLMFLLLLFLFTEHARFTTNLFFIWITEFCSLIIMLILIILIFIIRQILEILTLPPFLFFHFYNRFINIFYSIILSFLLFLFRLLIHIFGLCLWNGRRLKFIPHRYLILFYWRFLSFDIQLLNQIQLLLLFLNTMLSANCSVAIVLNHTLQL